MSPIQTCESCGGDMYHYAGCGVGEHGERLPFVPTTEALQGHTPGPLVTYEKRNGVPCVVLTRTAYEKLLQDSASAPDMLEALRDLVEGPSPLPSHFYERVKKARAAIERATNA